MKGQDIFISLNAGQKKKNSYLDKLLVELSDLNSLQWTLHKAQYEIDCIARKYGAASAASPGTYPAGFFSDQYDQYAASGFGSSSYFAESSLIDSPELSFVSKNNKAGQIAERIRYYRNQLRVLQDEQRKNFRIDLLTVIAVLLLEIQELIIQLQIRQKRYINRLKNNRLILKARDLRSAIRNHVSFLFKLLPDFSGCEEEVFSHASNMSKQSLSFHNFYRCTTINYYWNQ